MTAELYSRDELPGVIARLRERIGWCLERGENGIMLRTDTLESLLATLEAMALQCDDMAMLIRRLSRRTDVEDPVRYRALDYLARKGFDTSPLRHDATRKAQP